MQTRFFFEILVLPDLSATSTETLCKAKVISYDSCSRIIPFLYEAYLYIERNKRVCRTFTRMMKHQDCIEENKIKRNVK